MSCTAILSQFRFARYPAELVIRHACVRTEFQGQGIGAACGITGVHQELDHATGLDRDVEGGDVGYSLLRKERFHLGERRGEESSPANLPEGSGTTDRGVRVLTNRP